MRFHSFTCLIPALLLILSCQNNHEKIKKQFEELKSADSEQYQIAYAYATYLSTTPSIDAEEAIPMILELISYDYHTEARYCVDNLMRNGIQSWDLLALRGLCYFNELQPGLAMIDLQRARKGDPENPKIIALLNQVKGSEKPVYTVGELLVRTETMIVEEQYDSALFYMNLVLQIEKKDEYETYMAGIGKVLDAEKLIAANPGSYAGYLQKSQGLASMKKFNAAQLTLNAGLEKNPDNLNLVLAKALVWVQSGQPETASQYIEELEKLGMTIDPALKQQILQIPE